MEEVEESELVVERVAALDLGKGGAGSVCAGAARIEAGPPDAGEPRLRHHHRAAAGIGGVVAALGRAAGGDGVHQ